MLRERTGNSSWPKDGLRVRQIMTLVKDTPQGPSPHSLTHHLYILFDPLLIATLGQNHNPMFHLVVKGNKSWGFLMLLGNGRENRVLQENGVVQIHPGRKFRNAENLRLGTQFVSKFPKQTKSFILDHCFSKCGPWTTIISITQDLIRNTTSCSGRTWRERVGREVGGGIGMGKTCEPKAFSFQCMTKFTTKIKNKKNKK